MRTSVLTRSAIGAATLAVASATLVSSPATAATPSGITRGMVLTAASSLRSEAGADDATNDILAAMAEATCAIGDDEGLFLTPAEATQPGDDADGVLVTAIIFGQSTVRFCEFGAIATTDPAFGLAGTGTVTASVSDTPGGTVTPVTSTTSLSGDVAVVGPVNHTSNVFNNGTTFTAAGNATRTTYAPGTKKIADKKSKSDKKAAKAKYAKRLKAAKKAYAKALDRAGSSKSKKTKAKKAYSAAKVSAKTKYRYAIADYKLVKASVATTTNRPFSIGAGTVNSAP